MQISWKSLGPGLLYAGAAIGVSHLVQSTRAGAEFGLQLIPLIIIANLLKYPFFLIGQQYALHTRKHLLHGYLAQHKVWLWGFLIMTFCTMFIVYAAILAVTAAIFNHGLGFTDWYYGGLGISITSALLLIYGGFKAFNRIVKYLVVALSALTVFSLFMVLFKTEGFVWNHQLKPFQFDNALHLIFLISILGWMPAPIDLSVWQSMWTLEKLATNPDNASKSKIDFEIGYWGTTIMAVVFALLGWALLFKSGQALPASASGFANALIGIFSTALHPLFGWIAWALALATMFSTGLTVLDAYPRVIAEGLTIENNSANQHRNLYLWSVIAMSVGSLILLQYGIKNMTQMVDFATSISFFFAPILGFLNLKVYMQMLKENGHQIKPWLLRLSILGLVFMCALALLFAAYSL